MTTLSKPQQTDAVPQPAQGTPVPADRQAGCGDLEVAPDQQREPSGVVPVRGELEPTVTSGEDPPGPARQSRGPARSRRGVRAGEPLTQPEKPGAPPRTELSERLIVENQGLAHAAANKWARRCSRPFEDFLGPALEGLINGCRRYDPARLNPATGRPYAVSSCVCQFIEGAIKHHIRDHGYDLKLPSKWREHYPRVKRLLAEGQSLAQIVEALPVFTQDEITEMMGGMVGSIELEDELTLFSQHQPQATETAIVPALYALTEAAFASLRPADRGLLERWAADPARRPFPSGPMLQFHGRLKAQLRGRTLAQFRQGLLGIEVAVKPPEPRERRPRQPKPAPVVQPSLFARRKPHPKAVKL